jgi:cell division protease FtsH
MLAQALLEYETLSGKEVDSLLRGDGVFRPDLKEGGSDNNIKSSVPASGKGGGKDTSKGYEGGLSPQPEG